MSLQGAAELRARMRAIKLAFKPVGREWAEHTVALARPHVPVRTGQTQRSLRVKNASQRKATVAARFSALFLDRGTKAHDIKPRRAKALRFQVGGSPVFARKAHKRAQAGTHFASRAAREALRTNHAAETIIALWNRAGGHAGGSVLRDA